MTLYSSPAIRPAFYRAEVQVSVGVVGQLVAYTRPQAAQLGPAVSLIGKYPVIKGVGSPKHMSFGNIDCHIVEIKVVGLV